MSVFDDICLSCETRLLVPNSIYCSELCRQRDGRTSLISSSSVSQTNNITHTHIRNSSNSLNTTSNSPTILPSHHHWSSYFFEQPYTTPSKSENFRASISFPLNCTSYPLSHSVSNSSYVSNSTCYTNVIIGNSSSISSINSEYLQPRDWTKQLDLEYACSAPNFSPSYRSRRSSSDPQITTQFQTKFS